MISLEKMSNNISKQISTHLQLSKDKEAVIAYGAFSLIHTFWSTILLIVFGLLFNSLLEILLISIIAALLRQFTGGVHASSPGRCSTITVITFGVLSLFVKNITLGPFTIVCYQLITTTIMLAILYKNCPVDTPNKPISNESHKKILRKKSLVFIIFVYIAMAILWYLFIYNNQQILYLIMSIQTGLLWQSFMLTQLGKSTIHKLDSFLKKII